MEAVHPSFTVALALAAGVICQSLARHLRLPGIVVLLFAGVGLGPDGLGWVDPEALGAGLIAMVDIAVAVILFEGGLNLEVRRLRREQAAIRRLVTWGAVVTLVGASLSVRYLLGWDWALALLFGSLVVVTGPTVIGPLVAELRLKPRVATVLEAEGVLIDPIGALLAAMVLALVLSPELDSLASAGTDLVARLGFGTVAGAGVGFLLAGALRVRSLVPDGLQNIMTLALVLLLFEGSNQVLQHSGILAVTIAGIVVGNLPAPVSRDLREFKDQLTVLLIGLLFVLLAADVRFEDVRNLGLEGLAVVGALVLLVRPLGVWVSTMGSDLSLRERAFVAWVAPRGIVAAAIASLTAVALRAEGMPGGAELRALVFLTIAGTVVLAGVTGLPVARMLAVRLPERETYAILGANGLGLLLGEQLRAGGAPVVFLDSNPQSSRMAEEAGFSVVYGNALQERTLQRARMGSVRCAVGLTPNQTVNAVFANRCRELFGVPEGLVAVARASVGGLAADLVEEERADFAFEGPHDLERWDVRCRHGSVEVERRVYQTPGPAETGEQPPAPAIGERFVLLAYERAGRTHAIGTRYQPRDGDVGFVAVHVLDREEADPMLEQLGWLPETAEKPEPAAVEDPAD